MRLVRKLKVKLSLTSLVACYVTCNSQSGYIMRPTRFYSSPMAALLNAQKYCFRMDWIIVISECVWEGAPPISGSAFQCQM